MYIAVSGQIVLVSAPLSAGLIIMSEIIHLVARLKVAIDAIDWLGRDVYPKLRGPASADELKAFEARLGRKIPPSYREFLRMHNGMDGLEQYDWGIAGISEVDRGETFEDVLSGHQYVYKAKDARHPALADLKSAHVVGSDFDYQIAYFAPETMEELEPAIRRLSTDQEYDELPLFENFEQFLEFVVSIYEDLVDLQGGSFDDMGEVGGGDEDLLKELANLLKSERQPEPEPEPAKPAPKLSPEMELASKLCRRVLELLVKAELIEVVEGPGMIDSLEDLMLRKLLRSKSQPETVKNWIDALSKAREVEELYGTDEELAKLMNKAFDEVSQ